jgi:hypothetical protein
VNAVDFKKRGEGSREMRKKAGILAKMVKTRRERNSRSFLSR